MARVPHVPFIGILELCLVQLRRAQWQSTAQLAAATQLRRVSIAAVLVRNCQHKYAKVQRRQHQARGTWEYATYDYDESRIRRVDSRLAFYHPWD